MGKTQRNVCQYGEWQYTIDHGRLTEIIGDFEKEASWAATATARMLRDRGIAPSARISNLGDSHSYIVLRPDDTPNMERVENWAHKNHLLPKLKAYRQEAFEPVEAEKADALIREQHWQSIEAGYTQVGLSAETNDPEAAFQIARRLSHMRPPLIDKAEFAMLNDEIKQIQAQGMRDVDYRIYVPPENTSAFMQKYNAAQQPPAPTQSERLEEKRESPANRTPGRLF